MTTTTHDAQPKPGTVMAYDGTMIPAGAAPEQYPLFADCDGCGGPVACADGTASWGHLANEEFYRLIMRYQAEADAAQRERDKMPYTVAQATWPPAAATPPVARFASIKMAQYFAQALSIDGPDGDGVATSYEVADKHGRRAAYKGGQRWA